MSNEFKIFDINSKPNNIYFDDLNESDPYPFLNYIFSNYDLICESNDDLYCIFCVKQIKFNDINHINSLSFRNSVFCPECKINTIVPKSKIPDPLDHILNRWHLLAFVILLIDQYLIMMNQMMMNQMIMELIKRMNNIIINKKLNMQLLKSNNS